MIFIERCKKGVRMKMVRIIERVKVSKNQVGEMNRTNNRDPITKSN
jgi:hypothetical protein